MPLYNIELLKQKLFEFWLIQLFKKKNHSDCIDFGYYKGFLRCDGFGLI